MTHTQTAANLLHRLSTGEAWANESARRSFLADVEARVNDSVQAFQRGETPEYLDKLLTLLAHMQQETHFNGETRSVCVLCCVLCLTFLC